MQFSRLVALSTWGELVRAPLMVQFPPFGGGFAPLGALLRRVAGVSRLYWRNSPHPLLQQEDGVRRVAPLMAQFPRLLGSEVAVRGGGVTVRGGEAPTSPATSPKTLTTGVVGEVSCVLVAAIPGLVCRSHANR